MEKKITDSVLDKKLLAYSLAAASVLANSGSANAEVWSSGEINRIITASPGNNSFDISFDSNIRFVFNAYIISFSHTWAGGILYKTNNAYVVKPALGGVSLLGTDETIDAGKEFNKFNGQFIGQEQNLPKEEYYVGVRFLVGSNTHYGWIKLLVPTDIPHNQYTIVSYAYETVAGRGIKAGSLVTLPVELSSFTGELKGSSVSLKWNTATEVNNHGFEIERQIAENSGWEKIGFVEGHGNSNSPLNYSFVDAGAPKGKLSYRLKQIDTDGKYEYSKTVEIANTVVEKFELAQNYPNPFNPSTKIKFSLPEKSAVSLKVFNSLGQEVSTLVNGEMEAGTHEASFNASGLPSGIYVCKISAGKYSAVRKMMMIK
ncbi:MAG: T9SS type A sorting domain-containing protein [Bacteroidota bacterium]